ncbi:MAG: hypothetical protein H7X89_16520 [Rhizobiales bacterium]|nr:hypothetical protein [Hyphomicrobiales bacterium]
MVSASDCIAIEIAYEPKWPENWLADLVITWTPVTNKSERNRCETFVKEFEKAYSSDGLNRRLKKIVFLKEFSMSGQDFGGTYDPINGIIWSTCNAQSKVNHVGTLHHEFSSLLFYNNKERFDIEKWESFNRRRDAYMYSEEERWYDPAKIKDTLSLELNPNLYNDGFIANYNRVSLEEDINVFAEYIYTQPKKLTPIGKKYKRVHGKIEHLKNFYRQLGVISQPAN